MQSRMVWGVALLALALAALLAAPMPKALSGGESRGLAALVLSDESTEAEEEVVKMGAIRAYRLLDLEWKPGPVPGSEVAATVGDPKTGVHHAYVKLADATRLEPHWHSADEYVTVVSGTVLIGQGESVDPQAARLFAPGAFIHVPAKTPHYAWAKGEVILSQVRGGPVDFHWATPADDPAKSAVAPGKKP